MYKFDVKLVYSILIPFLASAIGGFFTETSGWYETIVKPSFNPPNWVFGPVWSLLYLMLGVALFLVWRKGWKRNKAALIVFGVQMVLNSLWSVLFFGLNLITAAFIEIILLWVSIYVMILLFYKVDKRTLYLLMPYLMWVSFALFLNYNFMILN